MSLIKTYLHSQIDMFHQNLKSMNDDQLSKLKDEYAEMIMDNMDYKDMERLLFDVIRGDMEMSNEEELKKEIIDFYDIETWEELVGE